MNDLGFVEMMKSHLFPNGIGAENGGGLNGYLDALWPYFATLAGIFVIILVGVQVITYFANPSKDLDPYILIRPILILAAMTFYGPLVSLLLDQPTALMTDITEQAAIQVSGATSMESFESFFLEQLRAYDGMPENASDFFAVHPVFEFLNLLVNLLALAVSLYIMIRQVLLLGVYYILGIFVLPFSLVPGNQEILKKWFFGFLAVFLWIPVLRIIQTLIIVIDIEAMNEDLSWGDFSAPLASFVLQASAVFFILAVPKFANLLVAGSGDSDSSGWFMAISREFYYRKLSGRRLSGKDRNQRRNG